MRFTGDNLLISSVETGRSGRWRRSEICEFGADAVDHGEDELFNFLRLNFGFGEKLGGSEPELRHLGLRDLAAGVDDKGQSAEGGLLTEPVDEGEAVAVREGEVEDEEVRWTRDALPDSLLA